MVMFTPGQINQVRQVKY